MTAKRILTWSSAIIILLIYCFCALWTIDTHVAEAEAQCVYYSICTGGSCCSGSTVSTITVAGGTSLSLCYHN